MVIDNWGKFFFKISILMALPFGIFGLRHLHDSFYQPFGSYNWVDCIFFYFSILAVIVGAMAVTFLVLKPAKETQFKVILAALSIFFVLSISEFYLRMTGVNKAYVENREGKYVSSYIQHDNNVNRVYGPGTVSYLQAPEFKYSRHHNNLGFSDADFYEKNDTNSIIIQTYGDSFTEGDGAPVDSSYPAMLRDLLKRDNQKHIIVQNFGICGNDPAFYWKQFKDIGVKLKPDIAVISFDCYDLTTDFLTKGGLDRFKGSYYKGFDGPCWEWLYGISYVYRLFAVSIFDVKYYQFFLSDQRREERLKELEPKWNATFSAIADIARKNNVKILLIKKPERVEVDSNHYRYNYSFFDKMVDTISCIKRFDLLPYYRDSAHINAGNSILYWWPENAHNKGTGYAIMARGVYAGLRKNYPEIFRSSDSVAITPVLH